MVAHWISLVIIEDETAIRESLTLYLKRKGIFNVLGSYGSIAEALAELSGLRPQVAIVDLVLPDGTGIELISAIKEMDPSIRCMVFSSMESEEWIFEAIKRGADGYLVKTEGFERVSSALEDIMIRGGTPISAHIARRIVQDFHVPNPDPAQKEKAALTQKENEILCLLSRGMTYKEIAGELILSPQTVATHVKKIYKKLQANNRIEAISRNLSG